MSNCLFCKIISGEIPAEKLYEDDYTLAFNDIEPKAPVHILLIPKNHYENINSVDDSSIDIFSKLFAAAKIIVKEQNLDDSGYRIVINSGKDGGQMVPHIHLHILGGRSLQWPPG